MADKHDEKARELVYVETGDQYHDLRDAIATALRQAAADERKATIDAALKLLRASERDYEWMRRRIEEELAKGGGQ